MMKKLLLFLCCMPFLMAATCEDNDDDLRCRNSSPGVRVLVRDGQTQESLADGVVVRISDINSDYEEVLQPVFQGDSYWFYGAHARPGSYVLNVTKPGYAPYENPSPFEVTRVDRCNVVLVGRTVMLQPL